jgi:hypothetical protein
VNAIHATRRNSQFIFGAPRESRAPRARGVAELIECEIEINAGSSLELDLRLRGIGERLLVILADLVGRSLRIEQFEGVEAPR